MNILFVSHPSYDQGIIGLVAGRLVEEFYQPAIVISQQEKYAKGSARSINGFDIIAALRKIDFLFEDLGGHPMAAGFTIETKKINLLEEKIKIIAKEIKEEILKPHLKIDLTLDLKIINNDLVKEIEKMAPFGLGNPRPLFTSRVKVLSLKTVGSQQKHLKMILKDLESKKEEKETLFEAIAFNLGYLAPKISVGQMITICFNIENCYWQDKKKIELKIKDIKIDKKMD